MMMAATFAGMGFGNAGVHIPHANAYPIAGMVQGLPARGLPAGRADGAARAVGVADRARGVPVLLRERARAAPAGGRAARPRTRTERTIRREQLPSVLVALMRDIGIPNGIGGVGYTEADVPDLVPGTMKQQRLLATCPRTPTEDDIAGILTQVGRELVTSWMPIYVYRCGVRGALRAARRHDPTPPHRAARCAAGTTRKVPAGFSLGGRADPGLSKERDAADLARRLRRQPRVRRPDAPHLGAAAEAGGASYPEIAGDQRPILAHEGRYEKAPLRLGDPVLRAGHGHGHGHGHAARGGAV